MSTIPGTIRPVLEQMRRTQEEAAAANAVKAQAYDVVFHRDIPYLKDENGSETADGRNKEHLLDVISPDDKPIRRPVILEVHGGGHLVLLLAGVLADPELRKYYHVEHTAAEIRATAATCPAGGLETFSTASDQVGALCNMVLSFSQTKADWDVCSIDRLIRRGSFPDVMILSTPTDDLLYEHTRRLHESFAAAEVPHVYREFVSETQDSPLGHVFNVLEPERKESIAANQAILKYFEKHLQA